MKQKSFAFLILAHKNPKQLKFLCKSYEHNCINSYIHIDKKSDINDFKNELKNESNITFIQNRVDIKWGGWSMVQATINLLRTASKNHHDYYFLISGEDINLKNYDFMNKFLADENKIYIDYHRLPYKKICNMGLDRFEKYSFDDFYNKFKILGKLFKIIFKLLHRIYKRELPNKLIPYCGSQWFILPHYCVEYILNFIDKNKKVVSFFKKTHIPDEMFFQSIILNSKYKHKVVNDNLRYVKWQHGKPHPDYLTLSEVNSIRNSHFFFARKFRLENTE